MISSDRPSGRSVEISVVTTLYRSRPYLEQFLSECRAALAELSCSGYELLFVNDGSPDDALSYLLERRKHEPDICIVDLSRNFGHHQAAQAGLQHARGRLIFLTDCDLEVSPSVLVAFHRKREALGCDVVYGYQDVRKGDTLERLGGAVFWKGFNLLSPVKVPENIVTERLMTRRYVDALLRLNDRNLFLGGMMTWAGFEQVGMPVSKRQRTGRSTYTPFRRLSLMVDAISSFSARPLYWLFPIGLFITLASFSYMTYLVLRKLILGDTLLGFTSIMGLLALTLGILTTAFGILGIYLSKIFTQVQDRPNYIVRDIYR